MIAIFLPENEYFNFPAINPTLLDKSLFHYSMKILQDANITQRETVPKTGRVIFLYSYMPLLQKEPLLALLDTVEEGYIEDEFVCMYWTNAEKAKKPFHEIKDTLTHVMYRDDFMVVNNPKKLASATKIMQNRVNDYWMERGVYMEDPRTTYISTEAEFEPGVTIKANSHIYGTSVAREGAVIGPNANMSHSEIGRHSQLSQSEIVSSTVGEYTSVGPFAYIRPGSDIGDNVKIGDFVEVKNATIGNETKASHLAYIGDADIGERVNFGCGTIIVNYDGENKHRSTIGDDVFIGCNSNLVSPVEIEDEAYIAAGSTITEKVPKHALAIARSRQEVKENWNNKNNNDTKKDTKNEKDTDKEAGK